MFQKNVLGIFPTHLAASFFAPNIFAPQLIGLKATLLLKRAKNHEKQKGNIKKDLTNPKRLD